MCCPDLYTIKTQSQLRVKDPKNPKSRCLYLGVRVINKNVKDFLQQQNYIQRTNLYS